MITDSQIGIQRPSKLRRAEQATRSGLLGFLTDHIVAKIVALLFAGVLVFLIDRELTISLVEGDTFEVRDDLPQGSFSAGQRVIILERESSVAIRSFSPHQVKVTIKGQQKLAEQMKNKAIVGIVSIKKEWLKADTQGSQTIDGSGVNFGLIGANVTIDPPIRVELDPEVSRDIQLRAAPIGVGSGLNAEVVFQPAEVRVLGPASCFQGAGAINQITITIPAAGRTDEFSLPVSLPEDLVLSKHIRMAPGQQVVARVRFSSEQKRLDVKDVPIEFVNNNDYTFVTIGLPRSVVTVTLSGTADVVASWNDRNDELRRTILAMIDTKKMVSKVAAQLTQPGSHTDEYGVIEIVKIPDNLKVVNVTPAQVDVTVTKR